MPIYRVNITRHDETTTFEKIQADTPREAIEKGLMELDLDKYDCDELTYKLLEA
jgi:hypothetical protein